MLPRLLKGLASKLLCGAALVSVANLASAQEFPLPPAAPLNQPAPQEDLKARLDRLEKQNQELTKTLLDLQTPGARLGTPVTAEGGDGALSKDQVTKIVADYLKTQEANKKKADAEKANQFTEVGSDLSIKAVWKDGVQFQTPAKDFAFHFGGRVHYDMGVFNQTSKTMPIYTDAADFRRARLRADGTAWEVMSWVCEVDFASPDNTNATATFTDVYLDINQLPILGTFRVGRWKEPFGLEQITSSRYLNTLERSVLDNAFIPARHLGLGFIRNYGDDENGTLSAGFFRTSSSGNGGFDNGDGAYAETGRITFLPVWADGGRQMVHLGAAASYRSFNNTGPATTTAPSFSSRTELRLGTPTLLSTGTGGLFATADSVVLYGGELAGNFGPLSFMAEIQAAQVNNDGAAPKVGIAPNPLYWGYYAQASYFLTGEFRPYNKKTGAFDRVRPNENFFLVRGEDGRPTFGRGAWEVVARYSYLDLSSDGFVNKTAADKSGGTGTLSNLTLGVNWYFNPNMKWQLNYVHAWRNSDTFNRSGEVNGLAMRFAWDF